MALLQKSLLLRRDDGGRKTFFFCVLVFCVLVPNTKGQRLFSLLLPLSLSLVRARQRLITSSDEMVFERTRMKKNAFFLGVVFGSII